MTFLKILFNSFGYCDLWHIFHLMPLFFFFVSQVRKKSLIHKGIAGVKVTSFQDAEDLSLGHQKRVNIPKPFHSFNIPFLEFQIKTGIGSELCVLNRISRILFLAGLILESHLWYALWNFILA